jgi:DNA-directed RNA polymerase specialized sigma24 family protein
MHDDTARAIERLQARLSRIQHKSFWHAEQIEEALNILLAQPARRGPPAFLIRNALADAAKKLSRRESIFTQFGPCADWIGEQPSDGLEAALIEIDDLIKQLTPSDQFLLTFACDAGEGEALAEALDIPLARARERLSRARARARAARDVA